MKDVEIYETPLFDKEGHPVGQLAVLRGGLYSDNPVAYMDEAVSRYVKGKLHNQFIEHHLDNPWVRVIITGINELGYKDFDK